MFFVFMNGEQYGPFTIDQIKVMAAEGAIDGSALYWKEGMPEWQSVQKLLAKPIAPKAEKRSRKTGLIICASGLVITAALGGAVLFFLKQKEAIKAATEEQAFQDAASKLAKASEESAKQRQKELRIKIEDAVANKKVIPGMTKLDVVRSIGSTDLKDSAIMDNGRRLETWAYERNLIVGGQPKKMAVYVFFLDDGENEPKVFKVEEDDPL